MIAANISEYRARRPVPVFLVKNWRFDPPYPVDPRGFHYQYFVKCFKMPGVPGQNSPDPWPHFANHFIVVADDGNYYDPSYGSPVFATKLAWENASIDGLGNGNYAPGSLASGGYRKSDLSAIQLLEFEDLVTGARL